MSDVMSCNQALLHSSILANQSYGQMLGTDAITANLFMTQNNDYQGHWANDGATIPVPPVNGTNNAVDADGFAVAETVDGTNYQINHAYLNYTDGNNGTARNDAPGLPIANKNYSNAQIQMQMEFIAWYAKGKSGDPLTQAQLYMNQWQTLQSAMSATQGINGALLKNNVDTYTSQLQLDQSNQQTANSALSGTLGDLMSSTGGALGQGM
jgi:hypothetical protein